MGKSRMMRYSVNRLLQLAATRPLTVPTTAALAVVVTTAPFSTSAPQCARKTRDNNRLRGVSELRRTGPRESLSVSWEPLPRPANYKLESKTDEDHGLWGFFAEKGKFMNTPKEEQAHGRSWRVEELRKKSWDDLHALWWACCRERNRISTANAERARIQLGFGEHESLERDKVVQRTMKAIKHVLTERYYLWEDAYQMAHEDPEIDLSGKSQAYTPSYEAEEGDFLVEEPLARSGEPASEANIDTATIPAKGKGQEQTTKA